MLSSIHKNDKALINIYLCVVGRIKFANESFSVYGVSVDNLGSYPNYGLVLLDDFDKMSK